MHDPQQQHNGEVEVEDREYASDAALIKAADGDPAPLVLFLQQKRRDEETAEDEEYPYPQRAVSHQRMQIGMLTQPAAVCPNRMVKQNGENRVAAQAVEVGDACFLAGGGIHSLDAGVLRVFCVG